MFCILTIVFLLLYVLTIREAVLLSWVRVSAVNDRDHTVFININSYWAQFHKGQR